MQSTGTVQSEIRSGEVTCQACIVWNTYIWGFLVFEVESSAMKNMDCIGLLNSVQHVTIFAPGLKIESKIKCSLSV